MAVTVWWQGSERVHQSQVKPDIGQAGCFSRYKDPFHQAWWLECDVLASYAEGENGSRELSPDRTMCTVVSIAMHMTTQASSLVHRENNSASHGGMCTEKPVYAHIHKWINVIFKQEGKQTDKAVLCVSYSTPQWGQMAEKHFPRSLGSWTSFLGDLCKPPGSVSVSQWLIAQILSTRNLCRALIQITRGTSYHFAKKISFCMFFETWLSWKSLYRLG